MEEIVEIFNLAYCPLLEKHVIIGKKYKCISNFYDNPCPLSLIGIHFVDQLDDNFSYWPLSQVSKKLTRYPHAYVMLSYSVTTHNYLIYITLYCAS